MIRIVAGAARSRRLSVPAGGRTRPTSDRVREALFSSLQSQLGAFDGLRVLDLYAGSGALGLEALSRGARHVLLVEHDARAVRVIRDNLAVVGVPGAVVHADRVERALMVPPAEPYHVVLADPPYAVGSAELTAVLAQLLEGWLTADARVVVERSDRDGEVSWPAGLVGDQRRRYGDTTLWYGRPAGPT